MPAGPLVERVVARAYHVPTSSPEADGTATWDATTLVVVHIHAGDHIGLGYTYASRAVVTLIDEMLAARIVGHDPCDIPAIWHALQVAVRNTGRSGIAAYAISALDVALWDLKAKRLGLPLVRLLGARCDSIPVYGSGGFTTCSPPQVAAQIEDWAAQGITRFKIKIGRDRADDLARIEGARHALPVDGQLFVDANGAYHPAKALAMAEAMPDVVWFEEPVTSDDIASLRFLREHVPAGMQIAAGEYSYTLDDSRRLLEADAVDTLQLDATRCLGFTGFLKAAALAEAYHRSVSSHCAPSLHAAVMCHVDHAVHSEYFADHARIEAMLFDGVPTVTDGHLSPQTDRPGIGWTFKAADAEAYAV